MNEEQKKQWEQDAAVYWDNAYFLYEFQKDFYEEGVLVDQDWIPAESNYQVQEGLKFHCIRRKDSAALPFDLERAKAGDIIEYKNWLGESKDFDAQKEYWKNHTFAHSENLSALFRMKYPPKVKPTNPG